jgi:hypothetical protein
VIVVGSRFQLNADDPAALPELRAQGIGLHFELLNGVGRRLRHHSVDPLVGGIDPINHERGLGWTHPVHDDGWPSSQRGIVSAGEGSRRQGGQLGEIAPVQREIDDLLVTDYLPDRSGLGLYERRRIGDGHRFGGLADLEAEINPGHLVNLQLDGRARDRLESRHRYLHGVRTRSEKWQHVDARVVGSGCFFQRRPNVADSDLGARNHGAGRVRNSSRNLSRLRGRLLDSGNHQACRGNEPEQPAQKRPRSRGFFTWRCFFTVETRGGIYIDLACGCSARFEARVNEHQHLQSNKVSNQLISDPCGRQDRR